MDLLLLHGFVVRTESFRPSFSSQIHGPRTIKWAVYKSAEKKDAHFAVPIVKIRILRSEDGDGRENVDLKVHSLFVNLHLEWFKSYMTYMHDRQQYVWIGYEMSGMRKSTHRVLRGPILEPALFNVYINDLLGVPSYCSFDHESYVADDSKLHISFSVKDKDIDGSARQITEDLKKVVSWCFQNTSLLINPDKTKLLIVTRRKPQNAPWDMDLHVT